MADDEHETHHDNAADNGTAAEPKAGGGAEQETIRRPPLMPRTLSHQERETLRARLQKKFH